MPSIPFGEQLKREREMRGVSIEEISAATRISTRFLTALEKEQWDQLPGGVFNRGFIRSVARFLGLDDDSMVAEYELQRKAENPEIPVPVAPPDEIPRNWRPAAAAIALFAALVAGGWFAYKRYTLENSSRIHNNASAGDPSGSTTIGDPGYPIPQGVVAAPEQKSPASSATQVAPAQPPVAVAAAKPLELKVQAGGAADVKILADGKIVFDRRVDAGQSQNFTAQDSFEVTSSESSAVLLELNGQSLPPIGKPGEPGSVKLTHKDLQPDAGGAH